MMVRVGISVEGQTEVNFGEKILQPYFQKYDAYTTFINLRGNVNLQRVKSEIIKIANNFDIVSTLYDFYGFKISGSGKTKSQIEKEIQKEIEKEEKAKNTIYFTYPKKFIPYLQKYEFEALLFSNIHKIENVLPIDDIVPLQEALEEVQDNPEEINNERDTSPSHRIKNCIPEYEKSAFGWVICKEIGLQKIRQECKGFNQWIEELETAIAHYP